MYERFLKLKYIGLALFTASILWLGSRVHEPDRIVAPDVTFATITGNKIALKELRGKPVIVTFWATDCPACIEEIPHLLDFYRQYHERGLEMIAVAMYYDPPSHVVSMTHAKQLPYHVALDTTAGLAQAFGDVKLTPTTFLISPDGVIDGRTIGAIDTEKMKTRLETLLKG